MQNTVILIVAGYMLLMLLIGWWSSTRIASNEDFMVAGRRLGPLLMAGTLTATEIGGGSSLGVVEKGFGAWGLSASWYVTSMGIAFVILTFFAHKFRTAEVKTVPEYFRRRYGPFSGAITAIVMILPLIGLTAAQFIASSTVVSVMLGLDYRMAVLAVTLVVTVYSVMGGLWSVTLTDFVQVFLILFGMAAALPYALGMAGGMDNVVANVPDGTFGLFKGIGPYKIAALVIMYIASFTVGQEAVSRYYAARDGQAARQGSIIAAVVNFVYAFIPTLLGIITLALLNMNKIDSGLILSEGPKYALPHLAMATMPAVIVGLLFSGILSATMSSADSDLLGAGSIFGNDLYKTFIHPAASSTRVLKVTRVTMVIIGLLAGAVAYFNVGNIITLLMFSFTLRAAGSFFPYVFGLYWKRASEAGAVASLIVGSATVLLMEHRKDLVLDFLTQKGFSNPVVLRLMDEPILVALVLSLAAFLLFCLIAPSRRNTTELVPEE